VAYETAIRRHFLSKCLIYFDNATQKDLWPAFPQRSRTMGSYFGHPERIQSPEAIIVASGVSTYRKTVPCTAAK
jgi:hypothetical protein